MIKSLKVCSQKRTFKEFITIKINDYIDFHLNLIYIKLHTHSRWINYVGILISKALKQFHNTCIYKTDYMYIYTVYMGIKNCS